MEPEFIEIEVTEKHLDMALENGHPDSAFH